MYYRCVCVIREITLPGYPMPFKYLLHSIAIVRTVCFHTLPTTLPTVPYGTSENFISVNLLWFIFTSNQSIKFELPPWFVFHPGQSTTPSKFTSYK